MLTNVNDFVRQWAPKLGDEAARLRWRGSVLLLWSYFLNFVWIPCVIAGAKVPSTPVLMVGALAGVIAGLLIVLGAFKLRAANKVAGELLGIKLGFGHVSPPPRQRRHYEEWCRQHGVAPYAANGPVNRPAG